MSTGSGSSSGGSSGGGDLVVREAVPADFERINEIYNWTIVDNHVSFDVEPWDLEHRTRWWNDRDDDLHCLVGELDGYVVGLTYASRYRPKPAYRTSMETTIVLDTAFLGRGFGTILLAGLLERLTAQDVHRAVAIVALPNDGSMALHLSLGYEVVGTLTEVGMKHGRFHDTTILEKRLP